MRSACACLDCFDVEFDPISVFKVMNAPIKGQQELEGIVGRFRHLSYHYMICWQTRSVKWVLVFSEYPLGTGLEAANRLSKRQLCA